MDRKNVKQKFAGFLAGLMVWQAGFAPGWAAPLPARPYASLTPPADIAALVASSAAESKVPQVLIIQDLHFNYSVQRNIARLLDFLGKKHVVGPVIAVEGAVGLVDNSPLTEISNLKVRAELSDMLMHNGELTGSQYYAVMSGQSPVLQGVEDPAYFQANQDIFRLSYQTRQAALRQLSQLKARVLTLVPTVCSRPVRRMLSAESRFENGSLSMDAYWDMLQTYGARAGVALPAVLDDYLHASAEHRQALRMSNDLSEAVNAYAVAVKAALAQTPEERNVVRLINEFNLAERALSQHTTLDEIRHVAARIDHTAALIRLLASREGAGLNLNLTQLQEALRASVDFYVAALMRNPPMLENTLKLVPSQSADQKSTVLVVGGFHSEYLTRELSRRGVSYAVYAPQVDSHTPADDALYAKRFMGERMQTRDVVAWLTARGGIRGSPLTFAGAGLVSNLKGLPWLKPLAREAVKSGSLYGNEPAEYLARLNAVNQTLRFKDSVKIPIATLDDLKSAAFDDDRLIPGGMELRAVLGFLMRLHDISLQSDDLKVKIPRLPLVEIELTDDLKRIEVHKRDQTIVKERDWDAVYRNQFVAIVPVDGQPGSYRALIHRDAIRNNPLFQKDPYAFWTLFTLHEIAEFAPDGPRVDHNVLVDAGLDGRADPKTTPTKLYREFARYLEGLTPTVIDNHARRAEVEFDALAYPYIREQRREGRPDLNLSNLNEGDIREIGSFKRRFGLVPGVDFYPAQESDVEVLDPKRVASAREDAIRAHLEGYVVDEVYAGGNASRMKAGLDRIKDRLGLTKLQYDALWFMPMAPVLEAGETEPIHWGARAMIRLNQSIRQVVRANPGLGVTEEKALSNRRIIIHTNELTHDAIMQDFLDHDFYGFNPQHIFFIASPIYHMLEYDPNIDNWVESASLADESVLGNGVPTELLSQGGKAYRLTGRSVESAVAVESSLLRHLLAVLPYDPKRPHAVPSMIKEWRINDLKLISEGMPVDINRTAYAIQQIRDGYYNVIEMVENPSLIKEAGGPEEYQKGGFPLMVKLEGHMYMMMVEKVSMGDPASAQVVKQAEEASRHRGDLPLINLMGAYKDIKHLDGSLEQGLPADFDPKITSQGKLRNEPQFVTSHATFDTSAPTRFFRVAGATLEDWKQLAESQKQTARKKLAAMNQDPQVLALAVQSNFDVGPILETSHDAELLTGQVKSVLEGYARGATSAVLRGRAEMALAQFNAGSRKKIGGPLGALAPREVHQFLAITGSLTVGAVIAAPALLPIILAWLVAALAQEVTVWVKALVARDWRIITSGDPIAWFDFSTQTEDSSNVPAVVRTFAHAHEMARALTQSRSAVIPRLFAPLTLALAVVDDLAAVAARGIRYGARFLRRTPAPDPVMLAHLKESQPRISALLEAPQLAAVPPPSGAWNRLWVGVQAAWKNSSTRRSTAEIAAREALSTAA